MKHAPWLLIYLRFALTVPAIWMGYAHTTGWVYILLLAIAATTDYYDGVLARKLNVETAAIRQWDSIADTVFFLGVLAGMWFAYPQIYNTYKAGIAAIIALEIIRYIFDYIKFQRGASYHAYSAKIFGVTLLAATIAIMGFGYAHLLFPLAIFMGIVSELEGLLMSVILKEWTYNVKHIGIAWQMSKAPNK